MMEENRKPLKQSTREEYNSEHIFNDGNEIHFRSIEERPIICPL